MRLLRVAIVALLLLVSASAAFCCSCSNNTPIEKNLERYQQRAVFTAHVFQRLGKTYEWDGTELSDKVLAVVHERYWGLPWYWPKIMILDGSYPCDTAMAIDEDYLVSGVRGPYGVVSVNVCSRTQPLKTAQVDLRTLDGSHCIAPGGTVIGRVGKRSDGSREIAPAANISLTFRDQDGNAYKAQTDSDGVYELGHVAPGTYTVESLTSQDHYASSSAAVVEEGHCVDSTIFMKEYSLRGKLLPGLAGTAGLIRLNLPSNQNISTSETGVPIEPDGSFYFRNVPDGEYVISIRTWVGGETDLYYPGTSDRKKAALLKVTNHALADGRSLEFNQAILPIVRIPVAPHSATNHQHFFWHIALLQSQKGVATEKWLPGEKIVNLYGTRGGSYEIQLIGSSSYGPTGYHECQSQPMPILAKPNMPPVDITVPAECQ